MSQPTVLMVPGRGNSEPGHWQSIIEARLPGSRRVQLGEALVEALRSQLRSARQFARPYAELIAQPWTPPSVAVEHHRSFGT